MNLMLFKMDADNTIQTIKNSITQIDGVIDKMVDVLSQDITTMGIWTVVRSAVTVSTSIAMVLITIFWLTSFLSEILEKDWRNLSLSWYFRKIVILIFAQGLVNAAPNIIITIYNFVGWAMNKYSVGIGASELFKNINFTEFKAYLETLGFCKHLLLYLELFIPVIIMRIVGMIIQLTVWYRILQICLLTVISPIPLATSVCDRHSGVLAFLKEVVAVMAQSIIMLLGCELYKGLVIQIMSNNINNVGSVWQLCVSTVVLLTTIIGSQKLAKLFLGR